MKNRPKLLVVLGALVTLSALILSTVATQATDKEQAAVERFKQVGEARASGDLTDVVKIGQQIVTLDDFQEQVRVVETNLEYMKGEINTSSPNSTYLQAFVQLIEQTGVRNVALGSLIQDRALYERALANGFNATDQEITDQLKRDRDLVQNTPEGERVAAYIKAVGQDRYWSELYPATLRREIAIQKMWNAAVTGIPDQGGREAKWNDVQKQAISSVSIDVLTPDPIVPATVSDALAYLNEYRQLPG